MFASNTNSAIDNVLEKILPKEDCPYTVLAKLRERDQIVRVGSNAQQDVADQFAPAKIAERQARELESERERLLGQRDALLSTATQLGEFLGQWKQAEKCLAEIARLRKVLSGAPDTNELDEEHRRLDSRRSAYSSAMEIVAPPAIRSLKRIESAYKGLLKLHTKSCSASLLLASKKRELAAAKEQDDRIAQEHARLRDNWFSRVFRRGTIEKLAHQQEYAAQAAEAAQSGCFCPGGP